MESKKAGATKPDKSESAVCGLFCPSCSIYIGTTEDSERLKSLADNMNLPVEEMQCAGCRSDKRIGYCQGCQMVQCAAGKGIDFCGACEDYPCEELKQFQALFPHRIELWKNQERIKEVGWAKWYTEMLYRYSCPQCGTINSAYDMACRKCGASPSCAYVESNQQEIAQRLANMEEAMETLKK